MDFTARIENKGILPGDKTACHKTPGDMSFSVTGQCLIKEMGGRLVYFLSPDHLFFEITCI